jgi:hypothetical protein
MSDRAQSGVNTFAPPWIGRGAERRFARLEVTAGRNAMARRILHRVQAVARPQWLPHPLLLNLIAALWAAAFALRLLELANR